MEVPFYIANAFTNKPFKGNPAGVVLEADLLNEKQMQRIAADLKCSETAFLMKSEKADYKLRYFTPIREVDLCGHATIATFYTMFKEGRLKEKEIKVETKAGIIGIEIEDKIYMEQLEPVFKEVEINKEEIAESLGIEENKIEDLPIEAVSTGLFSLNVPIKDLETMQKMKPKFNKIKEICLKLGVGSFFAFTFETIDKSCFIHARCFTPLYGVNEDPVTGTANAALAAYLKKNDLLEKNEYKAEQGYEVGREGTVWVKINDKIKIGGEAYIVMKGKIEIE